MLVGELCIREVVIIHGRDTIREAAKLMRFHHVGNVVAVENKNGENIPIGILTDRDIVLGLIATDVDIDAVTVGDVMSREILSAREDEDMFTALKRMRQHGIRRMVVVNEHGSLEGILAVDDIIALLSEQLSDLTALILRGQEHEEDRRP